MFIDANKLSKLLDEFFEFFVFSVYFWAVMALNDLV